MCLALGVSHPDNLTLTTDQFDDWVVFYRRHPFGPATENWRAGLVASTIYNVNRGKRSKALGPLDFVPRPPKTGRQRTREFRNSMAHLVKKNGE